ncbi:aspartate carbamoyltransferase regulatory subunit [Gottschalkiaceae bacterium SANA]|nr:aspartate carbamoyltransferase regulatory subunit [Gottschalkiaceae bacterium SANA]
MINVSKLKKGLVIDHIAAGSGYRIFRQLKLDELNDVVILMRNVPSQKMGKKDVIKIENHINLDLEVLGLIDPHATINVIDNGNRTKKIRLALPKRVEGILKCKNPRCITQYEKVDAPVFYLANEENKTYRCSYCDSPTQFVEGDLG